MGKTLSLPPGFRFHPTDVELVQYYLKRKILGRNFSFEAIAEIDVYKHAPYDLPEMSCLKTKDRKWYFFCPRERKYASGSRINRATEFGHWKTTGRDRPVKYNDKRVGSIKTLIFHHGRAPKGDRTDWVMHEYRLEDKDLSDVKDLYVLCMIFHKEGPGPRNGAQYGAPFKEEDWTDSEEDTCAEIGPSVPRSVVVNEGHVASSSQAPLDKFLGPSSESCVTTTVIPSGQVIQPVPSNDLSRTVSVAFGPPSPKCVGIGSSLVSCVSDVVVPDLQPVSYNDGQEKTLPALDKNDPLSFLYEVTDEDSFMVDENDKFGDMEKDFFDDLPDLGNLTGLNEEAIGAHANNAEMWSGRSYGSEDRHKFFDSSSVAAPNHPPQPGMMNRLPESDDINYGSQRLYDWRAK